MAGTYGTEHVIKVISFGTELGDAIKDSLADDGKITGLEYVKIVKKAVPVVAIVKNIKGFLNELGELDADDKATILAHFKEKFDLPDDEVEMKVEKGFKLAMDLVEYITSF